MRGGATVAPEESRDLPNYTQNYTHGPPTDLRVKVLRKTGSFTRYRYSPSRRAVVKVAVPVKQMLENNEQAARKKVGRRMSRTEETLIQHSQEIELSREEGHERVEEVIVTDKWSGVCHYNNRVRRTWDVVMFVLLAYTALITPFEIAFMSNNDDVDTLFVLNRIVDALFFVDLYLNFITVYHDELLGEDVTSKRAIRIHYLRTWFAFDLVSTVPFDLIGFLLGDGNSALYRFPKLVRILKLVRLIKLFRIFRVGRMFRRWKTRIGLRFGVIRIFSFLIVIVVVAHWNACFWFLVAVLEDVTLLETWVGKSNLGLSQDSDTAEQYIASLYWAVMTLTTIGYGDIFPYTTIERFASLCFQLVDAGVFAYIVGNVTSLVSSLDRESLAFEEKMDRLNLYMRTQRLTPELQFRLRQFFQASAQHNMAFDVGLLLEMSPGLRGEVVGWAYRDLIEKVEMFKEGVYDINFITDIAMLLIPETFSPWEFILEEGQPCQKMCLLSSGKVDVLVGGRHRLQHSGCFGEEVLMSKYYHFSVRSKGCYTCICSIPREGLQSALRRYPVVRDRLKREAAKRMWKKTVRILSVAAVGRQKMSMSEEPPRIAEERSPDSECPSEGEEKFYKGRIRRRPSVDGTVANVSDAPTRIPKSEYVVEGSSTTAAPYLRDAIEQDHSGVLKKVLRRRMSLDQNRSSAVLPYSPPTSPPAAPIDSAITNDLLKVTSLGETPSPLPAIPSVPYPKTHMNAPLDPPYKVAAPSLDNALGDHRASLSPTVTHSPSPRDPDNSQERRQASESHHSTNTNTNTNTNTTDTTTSATHHHASATHHHAVGGDDMRVMSPEGSPVQHRRSPRTTDTTNTTNTTNATNATTNTTTPTTTTNALPAATSATTSAGAPRRPNRLSVDGEGDRPRSRLSVDGEGDRPRSRLSNSSRVSLEGDGDRPRSRRSSSSGSETPLRGDRLVGGGGGVRQLRPLQQPRKVNGTSPRGAPKRSRSSWTSAGGGGGGGGGEEGEESVRGFDEDEIGEGVIFDADMVEPIEVLEYLVEEVAVLRAEHSEYVDENKAYTERVEARLTDLQRESRECRDTLDMMQKAIAAQTGAIALIQQQLLKR